MKTNCIGCCFLTQDDKGIGCKAGQYCILSGENVYTPGYCYLKRGTRWKENLLATNEEIDLLEYAKRENILSFDLFIVFDEWIHNIEHLYATLGNINWTLGLHKNIKILDITGNATRSGSAIEFLKNHNYDESISPFVDCSINSENPVRAIRRNIFGSRTDSRYYLILPAGKKLTNIDKLQNIINQQNFKNVFWKFPQKYGDSIIDHRGNSIFGLYHKNSFKFLSGRCEPECIETDQPCKCTSFYNNIQKIEKDTSSEIFLTHLIHECVIVDA